MLAANAPSPPRTHDHRYQHGLPFFARLWKHCIATSPQAHDVPARLQALCSHATAVVFQSVARGLLEADKRVFAFALTTCILRRPSSSAAAAALSPEEFACLVRGPLAAALACGAAPGGSGSGSRGAVPCPKPGALDWVSDEAWAALLALERCLPTLQGLTGSLQRQADEWRVW